MQFGYHKTFGFGAILKIDDDFVTIKFDTGKKNILRTYIEVIPESTATALILKTYEYNYSEYEINNAKTISFSKVQYNEKSNSFILFDQYDNTISVEYNNGDFTTICSCLDSFNCLHGLASLVYLSRFLSDIQTKYANNNILSCMYDEELDHVQMKELINILKENPELLYETISNCSTLNETFLIRALCLCDDLHEQTYKCLCEPQFRSKKELFWKFIKTFDFNISSRKILTDFHTGKKSRNINIESFHNEYFGVLYFFYNDSFDEIITYCLSHKLSDDLSKLFVLIYNKYLNDYDYSNINFSNVKIKNKEVLEMIYPYLDDETKSLIESKNSLPYNEEVYDLIDKYFENISHYSKKDILSKIKDLDYNEPLISALEGSFNFRTHYSDLDGILIVENDKDLVLTPYLSDLFIYFKPMVKVVLNDQKGIEIRYYLILPNNVVALKCSTIIYEYDDVIRHSDEIYFNINFFAGSFFSRYTYFENLDYKLLDFISYCNNAFSNQIKQAFINCKKELEIKLKQLKLNKINSIMDRFTQNNNEYKVNENIKAKLEISFISVYNSINIQFKIGVNKMYVVKNINEFINNFINNSYYKYGKSFSFTHNINQLEHPYDEVIKSLLLIRTFEYSQKGLSISSSLFNHLLEILKGTYITFNEHLYFLDLSEKTLKSEIDENMVLNLNLNNNQSLYESFDTIYILDNERSVIYKVKNDSKYKNFIKFAYEANGIELTEVIEKFNDEIYPYVNRYLDVSPMVSSKFKLSDLEIISYFDIDNTKKKLTVKEEYKREGINVLKSNFKNQDTRKYDEYSMYLESLGFYEGEIDDEDKIFEFLNMDFSHLKELCSVYLSESIQSHQVMTFQSPQIKIQYNSGIMECLFEESVYSNEELSQIYDAMKLKKKYVRLKDDRIVDIQDYYEFSDIIDDLHINKKNLLGSTQLPIYQALQAYAHKDMIEIDDYLKKMIDELTNFKNAKFKLPKVSTKLRQYQIEGFNWLYILSKYHMGGILADDMGLGKTLQTICLFASSKEEMPSLIVCPKSLTFNWKIEFEKFYLNGIDVYQINGNTNLRQDIISNINNNRRAVYITSYDSLRNDIDLYKDIIFKYIILDEAQYIKNVSAGKSLAVKQLKGDVKFALTGTPIENNVIDLWSIFDFIMPGYFEDLKVFKVKYNSNENYVSLIAKKVSAFILRRTKKNVLKDLPPKFETIIQASMIPSQRKLYDAQMITARNALMAGAKAFDMLPVLTRLRQLCIDPRLFVDEYDKEGGKITLLRELIPNYINDGHKILIFSQYVKVLKLIEGILNDIGLRYYLITGDTKAEDRIEYSNRFNASDEVKVFLVSLKAGGTGLNLVGADVVIHTDPWWNQAVEDQASDRAYRIGQKKNVEIVKLICENSIEQRVVELQNLKRDIIDKVISNDESSVVNATLEDIHFVLKE